MDKVLEDLKLNTNNSKLKALYEKVKPNKVPAKILTRDPGYIFQADLLFLPDDDGYKYCLTVVDTNNNAVDAVALKTKNSDEVIKGLKTIFGRKPLHAPKYSLETDPGTEFKNDKLIKFLNDKNIFLRVGARGRSNQQAIVEYFNGIIGYLLFLKMSVDEIETGEESTEWVEELPKVIASLNKHLRADKTASIERDVLSTSTEDIIPIGTKIRVALDKPVSIVDGKKLYGKFRKSDHRWENKTRLVKDISLRPNQPVMYFIEGKTSNVFTRNQLQIVDDKEALPAARKYVVEKLLRKFFKNRKPYFEVKWKNYKDTTEEPRSTLIKDVPEIVKEFEKKK